MTRIAPVHLSYNPKTLWFDACNLDLSEGDSVVVLTARGLEFGRMVADPFEVAEEQKACLKSPLKPVKRKATEEDIEQAAELDRKNREALPVFRELAAQTNEDMRPVAVEFLFSGDKAIFYFEAEKRIDFRELVHKLAAHFHVRIDMRQIGVRDGARMVGGIGHCGQELCCARLGGAFGSVSIRMAKEQDLSLNPQKISGLCGRLMCCLRFEYEAYKDFKSRAPKQNSMVDTPEGPLKVTALDVPRETLTLRTEDGKSVKVPLADMDEPQEEGQRRSSISDQAWEQLREASMGSGFASASGALSTSRFTRQDKLGEAKAVRRGAAAQGEAGQKTAQDEGASKHRRRRRSTKVEGGGETGQGRSRKQTGAKVKLRSKGSGLEEANGQAKKKGMQPRRRSKQVKGKGGAPAGEAAGAERAKTSSQQVKSKGGPRPGQKSSGLQRARAEHGERSDRASSERASQGGHRSSRRRSHKAGSPRTNEPGDAGRQSE